MGGNFFLGMQMHRFFHSFIHSLVPNRLWLGLTELFVWQFFQSLATLVLLFFEINSIEKYARARTHASIYPQRYKFFVKKIHWCVLMCAHNSTKLIHRQVSTRFQPFSAAQNRSLFSISTWLVVCHIFAAAATIINTTIDSDSSIPCQKYCSE